MPVKITTTAGFLFLDSWVWANLIQLETQEFCTCYLDQHNDPCGRQYDQMTQAARSVTANIAEGSSRHQTSRETEMKLIDVARASLSELSVDYLNYLLRRGLCPWHYDDPRATALRAFRLDTPSYTNDLLHEAAKHIHQQKARVDAIKKASIDSSAASIDSLDKIDFHVASIDSLDKNRFLSTKIERGPKSKEALDRRSSEAIVTANIMLILCGRLIKILRHQLEHLLDDFREEGGFTENMTQERLATRTAQSVAANAPACPVCGKPMVKKVAKKGINSGHEFWSCSDYPSCMGTRSI